MQGHGKVGLRSARRTREQEGRRKIAAVYGRFRASGIPVSLGGELDLTVASGVDLNSLAGETFKLFDWTGVHPTGQFNIVGDPG